MLSPLVTVSFKAYGPSAEKVAVVVSALGSANVTAPGPDSLLQTPVGVGSGCWRRRGRLSRLSGVIDLCGLLGLRTSHYGRLAISGPAVQIGLAAQDGDAVHSGAAGERRIHSFCFGFANAHDRALHHGRERHRRGGRLSNGSKQGPAAQLGFLRILLQGVSTSLYTISFSGDLM